MHGRRVVVAGATGMIGSLVARYALAESSVERVTTIGRRPTGLSDPKLNEVIHTDFSDCGPAEADLRDHDVALFCLGAYTGSVPDEVFRRVTVDYAVGFAESLHAVSPEATFCLLSGEGADPTERSRIAFARYKGIAENAVLGVGFARTHLFRPGYIYPVTPRSEPNFSYRVFRALYPVLRHIYPNGGISSEDLARGMLHAGLHGSDGHASPVLRNRDIRSLVSHIA